VEPIPKVPKSQFDAVLSRLLSTPPMPLSDITGRKPKTAKKRTPKKR
jgi:hypothetical protein